MIVIDTSAAVEIVLKRPKSNNLAEKIESADWVIAPCLFISELSNVFWKYFKFGGMPINDCETAMNNALEIPDEYVPEKELAKEAFSSACLTGMPAYDMFFLVLARRNNAELATIDKTLQKLAQKLSVKIA